MNYKLNLLIVFFWISILTGCTEKLSDKIRFENMEWVDDVGAKTFPGNSSIFNVVDYGAVGDGKTLNTSSIQKAIDDCFENGGGKVIFDEGSYLTGSVFIKEGVDFHISEDVEILGSQDIKDYPEIDTRVAGIEMVWPAALINILDQKNAAVSGKGSVFARGKPFWDLYWKMRKEEYEPKGLRWIVDYDCKRPRTLLVSNSNNITVKDITLKQAGFWTVHVLYSEYVTIDGIIIKNNIGGHGPSTDGVDIDSSEKILVQNCDIDCNDDNFCLKSGRDADGLRVNKPTRYIVIKDCIARRGGGLITLGSETSGGMSHILAYNMKAKGTSTGIRLKSAKTRGGHVEHVYVQDLYLDSVSRPFAVTLDWNPSYSYSKLPEEYDYDSIPKHWKVMLQRVEPEEKGIPTFSDIYVDGLYGENCTNAIVASGIKESILKNFHFQNVDIKCEKAGRIGYAKDWEMENISIAAKDSSKLEIINSENINWN